MLRTVLSAPSQPATARQTFLHPGRRPEGRARTACPDRAPRSPRPRSTTIPRPARASARTARRPSDAGARGAGRPCPEARARPGGPGRRGGRGAGGPPARCPPGPAAARDAEGAQHLQRAGVHDHGAGRTERRGSALDHPDARTVFARLQGQGEAGRAGAHHQKVRVACHRAHRRAETGSTAGATIMGKSSDMAASIRRGERGGIRRRTSSRYAKVPPWDGRAHVRGREDRRQESKDPVGGVGRLLRGPASREHRCR